METDIKKWEENFNQQLAHIQIEFDTLFVEGKMDDYYRLEADEQTGKLILIVTENNALPKQIEERLIDAFKQSQP